MLSTNRENNDLKKSPQNIMMSEWSAAVSNMVISHTIQLDGISQRILIHSNGISPSIVRVLHSMDLANHRETPSQGVSSCSSNKINGQ